MTPEPEVEERSDDYVSDEPIYDTLHTFEEDDKEYARITKEMKRNKIKFIEKRLKHAVYSKN